MTCCIMLQIYEAVDMFETTMLKEDRVEPNRYVFTVLIGVLGRVGYTKKAFQLFNRVSSIIPQIWFTFVFSSQIIKF